MASIQFASSQQGAPTIIFASATPGATYSFSTSIDLMSWDSVTLLTAVTVNETAKTANLKFQWSIDNTTFYDETTDTASASSGAEQPFVPYTYRIDISLDSAGTNYLAGDIRRLRRLARYFRAGIKSDATTGKVAISILQLCNGN